MTPFLVEALVLRVLAPVVLARMKNKRIALTGLLILGGSLTGLALSHLGKARTIDQDLARRARHRLAPDENGRMSAMEGIHVSVVDVPGDVPAPADALRSMSWELQDEGAAPLNLTAWFDNARQREATASLSSRSETGL